MDLYEINDALSALVSEADVEVSDDVMNELTHHVARTLKIADYAEPEGGVVVFEPGTVTLDQETEIGRAHV